MALTITPAITPAGILSFNGGLLDGNKPIVIKAASTNSGQPNFYLLCRIYASQHNSLQFQTTTSDTFAELIASARLIPASGDNFVNIDIAAIIRSQLVFNPQRLVDSNSYPTGLVKKYNIRFTEYFGTTPTASADSYYLTGNDYYNGLIIAKMGQKYQEWVANQRFLPSGYDDYTSQSRPTRSKHLSNAPEPILVKIDARFFVSIAGQYSKDSELFNASYITLCITVNNINYFGYFLYFQSIFFFNLLNQLSLADISAATWYDEYYSPISDPPITTGSTFTVRYATFNGDISDEAEFNEFWTQAQTFQIADCSFDEGAQVHFINELGGIDSFLFKYRKGDDYETLKQQFTAPINADTTFASYDRGGYDIEVQENQYITLTSDWLTQAQQDYLHQLISSTGVWIDMGGTAGAWNMLAVTVVDVNYSAKNYVVDDMASVTIKFKVANAIYKGGMI